MNRIRLLRPALLGALAAGLLTVSATAQPAMLTGNIEGLNGRPVIFRYTQQGRQKQDTVRATNGRFAYQPKPTDDGRINLFIAYPRSTSFWYEPGTLTVTGDGEKPYKLAFTGGRENTTQALFERTVTWPYDDQKAGKQPAVADSLDDQQHRATLSFIRQHADTKTGAYLLYWEAVTDQQRVAEHQQISQQLADEVRNSHYGKAAARQITNVINQPVVGKKAPGFSLPDTNGVRSSLVSFKGRYVLLDFWGHWCSPCLRAFGKLKTIQEQYAGKLTLIGIAAEFADDKTTWARTVQKYQANWLQLSELEGDKGSVNEQYNISAYPTYLLLDKEGTVIERANDLQAIEKKLATLTDH